MINVRDYYIQPEHIAFVHVERSTLLDSLGNRKVEFIAHIQIHFIGGQVIIVNNTCCPQILVEGGEAQKRHDEEARIEQAEMEAIRSQLMTAMHAAFSPEFSN